MTTWILIYVISLSGIGTRAENESVAVSAGSVVFHSQESCLAATKHFRQSFCLEDKSDQEQTPVKEVK